jgi:two-component system, chemotaxis family, CheB/CheR fusion protein
MTAYDRAGSPGQEKTGYHVAPDRSSLAPAGGHVPVVGIGASAGGLDALRAFFGSLPEATGMAYIVVAHLSPEHPSELAAILQRHTGMSVAPATDGARIEPEGVHVIRPDHNLAIADGRLRLLPRAPSGKNFIPIDVLFRSLADAHGPDATGIVLSGNGSDGAQGLRRIYERGGITMAQHPDDAAYAEMPEAAIRVVNVDRILPAGDLGPELVRQRRFRIPDEPDGGLGEGAIESMLAEVRKRCGHDFAHYALPLLRERLHRRMRLKETPDVESYLDVLRRDEAEVGRLDRDLLSTAPAFFEGPAAFARLEEVVGEFFARRGPQEEIRIWVPGCGTGEEVYSVAMVAQEHLDVLEAPPKIKIFGTDQNERAFAIARDGLYPEGIAAEVEPERLERHFDWEPGGYRVHRHLRERVVFAAHHVLRDPPFPRLDLVVCRTLLPCLRPHARHRALRAFHYGLVPGGHLFLGQFDSVRETPGLFVPRDEAHRIYRALEAQEERRQPGVPGMEAPLDQETGRRWARPGPPAAFRPAAILHHRLVELYAPPSLLVNEHLEVVHLSENAGRYLEVEGGVPSVRLSDLVGREARAEVAELLERAFETGTPVRSGPVELKRAGRSITVRLAVRPSPLHLPEAGSPRLALVVFEEEDGALDAEGSPVAETGRAEPPDAETELREELRRVRERLHGSMKEHAAAVREYQAANEELQATQGDLRSAHEEQAMIAEELRARQEELWVVNKELEALTEDRQRTIDELAQTNMDLETLIDSTAIATVFLDTKLGLRRFTSSAADLFRLRSDDLGRPFTDLAHRLDYPELVQDLPRAGTDLERIEKEVRADDGRWHLVRLAPYRSADERVGIVIALVDTTERERLLREARRANEAKSDFLRSLSHEFRTPLSVIVGYLDLLTEGIGGDVNERQRDYVGRARGAARQLTGMLEEMLVYQRLEGGRVEIDFARIDPGALMSEAVRLIELQAEARDLPLHVELDPDLPEVFTDEVKLRQILFNLLGNAVRYTHEGQVTARARSIEEGIVFEVEDTGIGIDSEDLDRIFDRFWQVEAQPDERYGGTGLGLTVARDLARLLGGDITVESEPGRGSRFTLRLPLVAPGAE